MQLPLLLRRRGLLGFMDEQDKPRGLFRFFGDDSPEDEKPPSAMPSSETDVGPGASDYQCADCASAAENPGYLQRQLSMALRQIVTNPLGVRPITRNPVTGEINYLPHLKSVGDRYSDTVANLPLPGGAIPPRPGAAPVTPLSRPGFLFGPNSGAIGRPQAEDAESLVYRLPPQGESEEDCDEQEREELERCHSDYGEVFGYDHWSFHGCKQRAQDRAILCRKGRTDGPLPWSDADVDGIVWPKPPKRRR